MAQYWQKLKDPRWQRKRLEVMKLSDFACEICGDKESTLNVHHKEYFKGREPWEYDSQQLAVLCESCHESQHEKVDALKMLCSYLPVDGPWSRDEIALILAGFGDMPYEHILSWLGAEDSNYYRYRYNAGKEARTKFEY